MKEDEAGFRRSFEAHLNYFRNLRKETMARTGRGMNVTEFLEARIAEDEKWARQEDADYADTTLLPTYDSDHQANWNTERVLAECAAKRAIIKQHEQWPVLVEKKPEFIEAGSDPQSVTYRVTQAMVWLTEREYVKRFGDAPPTAPMIRTLAAIYADHPDYQQEWAL